MALGLSAMVNAGQSCRIDGGSIDVTGCSYNNGVVTVVVANDSPNNANVKVTVVVYYGSKSKEYTTPYSTFVSANNSGKEIKINVDPKMGNLEASGADVKDITGTKCQ